MIELKVITNSPCNGCRIFRGVEKDRDYCSCESKVRFQLQVLQRDADQKILNPIVEALENLLAIDLETIVKAFHGNDYKDLIQVITNARKALEVK